MNHLTNSSKEATPTEVADAWEMLAQMCIDEGDQEDAQDFMQVAHAIRRVLTVLNRLNNRVNTCYDFNADPDSILLEVGDALRGYVAPDSVRPGSPVAAAAFSSDPHTHGMAPVAPIEGVPGMAAWKAPVAPDNHKPYEWPQPASTVPGMSYASAVPAAARKDAP